MTGPMCRSYVSLLPVLTALCLLVLPSSLRADDPIVTKAMTATTIAEIAIAESEIRVEFEIGVSDLEAFQNVLPDELYKKLGLGDAPLSERFQTFFQRDFVVRLDGGEALAGRLEEVVGRRRVRRDEISGQPLPSKQGEGEAVVFVVLSYPCQSRPSTVTLTPPGKEVAGTRVANVGFVAYHRGLPVNDFRYLSQAETVDLDWDDPWFSRFRNRNLLRQNLAPISAYLYVEHFEVRKEVVVRPVDLQQWIDLGLAGRETISVESQPEILRRVGEFLAARGKVTIDGREVTPELDRIHFLRRGLRQTGVIDPPEELDVVSATLGVIFVYPVESLPQRVTLDWDLFHPKFPEVPSVATDEAGGLPSKLTAEDLELVWQNFLTNPKIPAMMAIAPPPGGASVQVSVLTLLCGVAAVFVFWRSRRAVWSGALWGVGLLAACWLASPYLRVAVPIPFAAAPALASDQSKELLGGLLHNIYRAFDHRREEVIYDTLAHSVAGELLADIYLETRRGLEVENQGGARARVEDVELVSVESTGFRDAEPGTMFDARCTWIVAGSVGHWGHIHQRRNQYEARFTVSSASGAWRLTGLELLSEERL